MKVEYDDTKPGELVRETSGTNITKGHHAGNDTFRKCCRRALMVLMVEKLKTLLHDCIMIFIRGSKNGVRQRLMQNAHQMHTLEQALKIAKT